MDDWAKFRSRSGFGQKTGIDIDGELPGILPTREWKAKRAFRRTLSYMSAIRSRFGIGQGFNTFTPLQMAYATAILPTAGSRSSRTLSNGYRTHAPASLD